MAEESYPQDLKYSREHDWVRVEGGEAVMGVTWFAQNALTDVVFAELPEPGTALAAGEPYGVLESVKVPADVYAPVGGTVVALNEALATDPGLVNTDPYGAGWLVRVTLSGVTELETLMDAEAYQRFLAEAGG